MLLRSSQYAAGRAGPPPRDGVIQFRFQHARQRIQVTVDQLRERLVSFLEHYCAPPFVAPRFTALLGGRRGEERLAKLLELCGFPHNCTGFLEALLAQLARANGVQSAPIVVGGLELPYHLLLSLMELLLPGRGFKTIKTVGQLEAATNVVVPEQERGDLQTVLERYPVRLSYHTLRQMRLSPYVSAQYHPFAGELDQQGEVNTWVGQFHWGVVERMYQNRVIFIMNMACPVYCRFCFRKHKECRNQKAPTQPQVKEGVRYLRQQHGVREVVLTGGTRS